MTIPITFEYENKLYQGEFGLVSGGGSTGLFHLHINNYYYGQLFYTNEWRFCSNKDWFKGMDEFFGAWIIAAYDCM